MNPGQLVNKYFIQIEGDIIPIKWAIKFNPPIIALEYSKVIQGLKMNYLLNINLTDLLKIYDSPDDITKWIFRSYSDVITKKTVKEIQVNI